MCLFRPAERSQTGMAHEKSQVANQKVWKKIWSQISRRMMSFVSCMQGARVLSHFFFISFLRLNENETIFIDGMERVESLFLLNLVVDVERHFFFVFNAIMIFLLYQMTGQFCRSIFGSSSRKREITREREKAKSNSRFVKFSPVAFSLLQFFLIRKILAGFHT